MSTPTPLQQFWTGEIQRLDALVEALEAQVATQSGLVIHAREKQADASDAVTAHAAELDAARRALSGIPMPADGDPLLEAMERARVEQDRARAALAGASLALRTSEAELGQLRRRQALAQAEQADARKALAEADRGAERRAQWVAELAAPDLASLAGDAQLALDDHAATAQARVAGEFPVAADDEQDFLRRVRARRDLAHQSLSAARTVADAALAAEATPVDQARQAFERAASAVRALHAARPTLAADRALLQRLAALPAVNPPDDYPILTRWQHERLHDPNLEPDRRAALAKLTAVDDAGTQLRTARADYDQALHAAMRAAPDKSRTDLEADVATERTALDSAQTALDDARAALDPDEQAMLDRWFAAVPEQLWDELDRLDAALARLQALAGASADDLVQAMDDAEQDLVDALDAAGQARRAREATQRIARSAAALMTAELETLPARSQALGRSAVPVLD